MSKQKHRRPVILSILFLLSTLPLTACGTFEVGIERNDTSAPSTTATLAALATENARLSTEVASLSTAPTSTPREVQDPTPMPTLEEEPSPIPTMPTASVSDITEPLLIDGEKGWMFASARADGFPRTVKLATRDGRLLAVYDVVGRLALDRAGNRLFVDQGEAGVAILDAETGALQATVSLPTVGAADAGPQVDPASGLAYVFRDQNIYVIDPATAIVERTMTLSVATSVCGESGSDAFIAGSLYDLVNHRLYLVFVTYVCTPWLTHTIIAYDADTLAELGRYDTGLNYQAVPFSDSLYGTEASRLGRNVSWAWNGSDVWFEEGDMGRPLQGIVADWGRQLVYEALDGQMWVFTPYPRDVLEQVDVALLADGGRLAGHDPISDQLYFLVDGQLVVRPTSAVLGD